MNKLFGLTTFLVIVLVLIAFSRSNTVSPTDITTNYFTESPATPLIKVIGCAPDKNRSTTDHHDDTMMMATIKKQFFATPPGIEEAFPNDNKRSAGILQNGILTVNLEARDGMWFPETHEGKGIHVFSFAEKGKSLQLPGPLIRVPEGTVIKATIHNTLDSPLVLHGFCSRPAIIETSITIAPGDTYETSFKPGVAGTYFYRASASDSLDDGGVPFFTDSQLYGAFIVDPANIKPDPKERIIMIGIWNDTLNGVYGGGEELSLNGLTWPYTERLTYLQGEKVNWRVINASIQPHPMHLHGFFFDVKSKGGLYRDTIYKKENFRKEVTELLQPGETISMQWVPERPGNWLFHCHTLVHITPGSFLREVSEMQMTESKDLQSHVWNAMGGLIMGLHVLPSGKKMINTENKKIKERQLTLIIKEKQNWYDTLMGNGFILLEGNQVSDNNVNVPGPPIILNRDEPISIKVINRLNEATTVHWHGLEIESYFDGVSGWGNKGKLLAPMIQPGDSFVVHMKPPRTGTYIYHTHMHNNQLLKGMYGPMIVKDPGEKYDADKNRIFLIGQGGNDVEDRIFFINGKRANDTMLLEANKSYRFRIINITALAPLFNVSLIHDSIPVNWKILAKDGADFPSNQQITKPAFIQTISIGETIDFEFQPTGKGDYQFEVRGGNGTLRITKLIRVFDKP